MSSGISVSRFTNIPVIVSTLFIAGHCALSGAVLPLLIRVLLTMPISYNLRHSDITRNSPFAKYSAGAEVGPRAAILNLQSCLPVSDKGVRQALPILSIHSATYQAERSTIIASQGTLLEPRIRGDGGAHIDKSYRRIRQNVVDLMDLSSEVVFSSAGYRVMWPQVSIKHKLFVDPCHDLNVIGIVNVSIARIPRGLGWHARAGQSRAADV